MLVRPMLGSWEPPRIERIATVEARHLAVLPVAGLSGDLHQDLGRGAIAVEICGSLMGDEARDDLLKELRAKFLDGSPVDFVADIVKESELEQVLIEELRLEEVAGDPDMFRYRIVVREYTEPPEPPAPGELGAELDAELGDLADLGLDALDLPGLLAAVPKLEDVLQPLKPAAESLGSAVSQVGTVFEPLRKILEGS